MQKQLNTIMAWDDIRRPWQNHILGLYKIIDAHSEQYVKTGDPFHLEQRNRAVTMVTELKEWIIAQESIKNSEKNPI